MKIEPGNKKLSITWTDPEDTALDEITFVEWKGTVVVRKTGGYPESPDDGKLIMDSRIRNQYTTVPLVDNTVENNIEYYYRLFPYAEYRGNRIYHMGAENRAKQSAFEFSNNFAENTWEQIVDVCKRGIAKDIWSIGDEKELHISNYVSSNTKTIPAMDIKVKIAGFDLDERYSDGTSKNLTTFCLSELIPFNGLPLKKLLNTYYQTYANSYMLDDFGKDGAAFKALPEVIRNAIVPVKKAYMQYENYGVTGYLYEAYLFPPSEYEVSGQNNQTTNTANKGYTEEKLIHYPIFTDDKSRLMYVRDVYASGLDYKDTYWLRTYKALSTQGSGTYTYWGCISYAGKVTASGSWSGAGVTSKQYMYLFCM